MDRGVGRRVDWGVGLAAAVVVYGAVFVVWTRFHWGGDAYRTVISDWAFTPVNLLAALLAWRAAWRLGGDPRRRAWVLIGAAFFAWWLADANWVVSDLLRHTTPFPSWSDVGYLAFYPLLMWGLLSYPAAPRQHGERLKLALDAVTVLIAGTMVVWFVAIGPTTRTLQDHGLALIVTLAYPIGDLVVIFAMVLLILRGTVRHDRVVLGIVLCGVGLFVIADLAFARLSLNTSYQAGSWPDACWMLAQCLFVLAAAIQGQRARSSPAPDVERVASERISRLPYLAIIVGVALVASVAVQDARYPLNGLIIGTVALVSVVLVRQLLAQRENMRLLAYTRTLAATDGLTGLSNRRAFFERADSEFAHARRSGRPLAALMIDVDHFKTINDTYGHPAGDLVLQTLGLIANQALRASDVLCRYGGDEFVALLPNTDTPTAVRIAERLTTAVTAEHFTFADGQQITVTLSIGASDNTDCGTVAELLERADHALYQAKRAGRARIHTNG